MTANQFTKRARTLPREDVLRAIGATMTAAQRKDWDGSIAQGARLLHANQRATALSEWGDI